MRVTVLGCGTSAGVPQIGCTCAGLHARPTRATSAAAARSSSRSQGQRILVDTGPDLRQQCLDAGIGAIDALLYTHAHADHVHGIDDLRSINNVIMAPIQAYADEQVFARIRSRFPYVFEGGRSHFGFWRPDINPHPIDGPFRIGDVEVIPFRQKHGRGESWGFRIGPFAYSTDTDGLSERGLRERCAASRSGSSTRCATSPTPATPTSDDAGLDRAGGARARPTSPT